MRHGFSGRRDNAAIRLKVIWFLHLKRPCGRLPLVAPVHCASSLRPNINVRVPDYYHEHTRPAAEMHFTCYTALQQALFATTPPDYVY